MRTPLPFSSSEAAILLITASDQKNRRRWEENAPLPEPIVLAHVLIV